MDIEERAERYAAEEAPAALRGVQLLRDQVQAMRLVIVTAYLAGSAVTAQDYERHIQFLRQRGEL